MGRKAELRQVDAVAHEYGLDRHVFGDYIHEVKEEGEHGSGVRGDFTPAELRVLAEQLKSELGAG